jgi:TolB protein
MATSGVATAAYPGANGRIVFEQGGFEQGGTIYSIRPDGSDRRQLTTGTSSHSPRWSPDGRLIAFNRAGDLWVMQADGSAAHRITSGAASDINPSWSPDGGRLVFSRTTDGTLAGRSLYVVSAAGGSGHRQTATSDGCAVEPTWSATGRYVVYWDKCASGVTSGGNAIRKVNTGTGAISVVVGVDGLAQPDGRVFFSGTGPDVTPGGGRVVFTAATAASDLCGVAITDLSGRGFRFLSAPVDCGIFLSNDPSVSPDGTQVVYTAGNENPQLDVIRTDGSLQCCHPIYESGTNDFPVRPDWQPRP